MNENQEGVEENDDDDVTGPCSSVRKNGDADSDEPGDREEGCENPFHVHGEECDSWSGDSVVHRSMSEDRWLSTTLSKRSAGEFENSRHVILSSAVWCQSVETAVVHIDEEGNTGDPDRCEGENLPDPRFSSRYVESGKEDERNGENGSDGIELSLVPVAPWSR